MIDPESNRKVFSIHHPDELTQVAVHILSQYPTKKIIFLEGDLGAGKTRLVECFMRKVGYSKRVSSPTFSLINEYENNGQVFYHMDLYRIEQVEELFEIGIEEYLNSGHYCFIEWPQILEGVFDMDALRIKIEIVSFSERKILI